MKKLLTYYIFGLLVFALSMTACTEDTSPASTEEPGGRVVFAFTIGSGIQTRATEPGWEDWNENTIEKVDLYIFREGSLRQHLTVTSADLVGSSTDYTWTPTDLTRDDIQTGDEIYAVANCKAGGLETVTNIEELKSLTVTGLETPGKQELFLMDGHITVETIDNTENILVTIPLKRAAAKIRLTFSTTSKADWEDRIAYRFCQYATTSTVLDLEDGSYLDEAGIHTYPEGTKAESMHEVTDEDLYTYNGKQYLVLYSFANDWFDENKADEINQTEPIVADKQTYILLKAPYEGKEYYYKIPVNYRLPTNNDDTSIKPEDYRHLYRLQRNYIYDITATIDREGGTTLDPGELLTLTYAVNAWEEKDITVNYEDNLSYTSSGWEEKDEEGNTVLELLANNTVHFVDPNGIATLSFMIQTPAVATWRAVLAGADLNYFEFVGDHAGAAYQNDEPVAQTLSIRCTQPDSEDTHSVTLHVYATIGGKDYELDLTNSGIQGKPEGEDEVNRFTILQGR